MSTDRRFHNDANAGYLLPNDTPEHARLEEQARQLTIALGGRVRHAPLTTAARVLDIGCGTGVQTQALAQLFPAAAVFGLDLSPIPPVHPTAANVHFLRGNFVTQPATAWRAVDPGGLTVPTDEAGFDYLYHRLLLAGIDDWPGYVRTQFGSLRSGGWAEAHELDNTMYDASADAGSRGTALSDAWPWYEKLERSWQDVGLDLAAGRHVAKWMREAGFVDVQSFEYPLPVGGEGQTTAEMREFGEFWEWNIKQIYPVIGQRALGKSQWTEADTQELQEGMARDLFGPGKKINIMYVTIGRKP